MSESGSPPSLYASLIFVSCPFTIASVSRSTETSFIDFDGKSMPATLIVSLRAPAE